MAVPSRGLPCDNKRGSALDLTPLPMPHVKRLVLDVLKPHHPDSLEFCLRLATLGADYRVKLEVVEVDEHTETTRVTVDAESIDIERLREAISQAGASLHSVDEVEVTGSATPAG